MTGHPVVHTGVRRSASGCTLQRAKRGASAAAPA
jgi:hypothetical protein